MSMRDAPDPLGKRALFWAPAEREEDSPGPAPAEIRGRHALFSAADAPPSASRRGIGGIVGPIALDCSSCGSWTEVDVAEYLRLHLPLWFWRPGKGYTRLMTCPACRKRTWVSASLPAWSH